MRFELSSCVGGRISWAVCYHNHTKMRELQRKQNFKRILYSLPSLIILTLITIFLAKGAFGIMSLERRSAQRVQELEGESQVLTLREQELKAQIDRLKTEEGVVEEIKRKFSVTRAGEHVAIIVDAKAEATSTETSGVKWLKNLWHKFKNLW